MKNFEMVGNIANRIKVKAVKVLKVVVVIMLLMAIYLIRVGIGTIIGSVTASSDNHIVEVSSYDVMNSLGEISELMTYSMDYSGTRKVEDYICVPKFGWKVPFTGHTICVTYCGTIKVGYDLSQVSVDVDNYRKKIFVTLPDQMLIDNNLPEESVYSVDKNNVLNPIKSEEIVELLSVIKEEEYEKALEKGISGLAESNAKRIITETLGQYEGYEVVCY